jgi:hypothetical protein
MSVLRKTDRFSYFNKKFEWTWMCNMAFLGETDLCSYFDKKFDCIWVTDDDRKLEIK